MSSKEPHRKEPPPPPKQEPPPPRAKTVGLIPIAKDKLPARQIASTALGAFLLVLGGMFYAFHRHKKTAPKTLLLQAAQKYLSALQERKYEEAYSMLSRDAGKNCTLEEFKQSQDISPWSFTALKTEDFSQSQALVVYTLQVSGREPEEDWLRFIWEDGKWVRAYWWNLSSRIEEALDGQDARGAFAAALTAAQIDPYDPLARSYVCEAAYAVGDIPQAERECLRTLELAKTFRSDLDDKGLYHIHAILGDIYKNHLARFPEASRHFDILLALPGLQPSQQCDAYLARAETLHMAQDDALALSDIKEAEKACSDPEARRFLKQAARILGGKSGEDAIAILKKQRMPDGKMTYLEWRQNEAEERIRKAKTIRAIAAVSRSQEEWLSKYLGGSSYGVSLLSNQIEILTAQVDLWTRKMKVDIHVQ